MYDEIHGINLMHSELINQNSMSKYSIDIYLNNLYIFLFLFFFHVITYLASISSNFEQYIR